MWTFPALISLRDWSCNDEMPCCFNTSREIPLGGKGEGWVEVRGKECQRRKEKEEGRSGQGRKGVGGRGRKQKRELDLFHRI